MNYDKGPQLTIGRSKEYLALILDNVKICVGIGDKKAPAHYLLNRKGMLMLHPDCYMQNAAETNLLTVLSFCKKEESK